MAKKAKRVKVRRSWSINPRTRVKKSKKIYSRKGKNKGNGYSKGNDNGKEDNNDRGNESNYKK